MRKNIMFLFCGLFMVLVAYPQETVASTLLFEATDTIELNWIATYKEALKQSKKENKPVLIYFTGSDWCGPCIRLDREFFHTKKFKAIADKDLILLEVDLPRNQDLVTPDKMSENLYLKKKYKVKAFPTILLVNHRGRKIAEKRGYILTEYYYPFIRSAIKNY